MTVIKITNPHADTTYRVAEDKGDIECALVNVKQGLEDFILLHDAETGNAICIAPGNCASFEILS